MISSSAITSSYSTLIDITDQLIKLKIWHNECEHNSKYGTNYKAHNYIYCGTKQFGLINIGNCIWIHNYNKLIKIKMWPTPRINIIISSTDIITTRQSISLGWSQVQHIGQFTHLPLCVWFTNSSVRPMIIKK